MIDAEPGRRRAGGNDEHQADGDEHRALASPAADHLVFRLREHLAHFKQVLPLAFDLTQLLVANLHVGLGAGRGGRLLFLLHEPAHFLQTRSAATQVVRDGGDLFGLGAEPRNVFAVAIVA